MALENGETSYSKGRRIEKEARDILRKFYHVEDVPQSRYGRDLFNLVDIICISPEKKPRFIQVKTNGFNKKKYRMGGWKKFNLTYSYFEVWDRIDYQGWKIWRLTDTGFKLYQNIEETKIKRVQKKLIT